MKLKTTKVFVPVNENELVDVTANYLIPRTGDKPLQEKELFCHTKEELISIISDAFESGYDRALWEEGIVSVAVPKPLKKQEYINKILEPEEL
jgi:hypothetical protein